jgi:hypothetical protein
MRAGREICKSRSAPPSLPSIASTANGAVSTVTLMMHPFGFKMEAGEMQNSLFPNMMPKTKRH